AVYHGTYRRDVDIAQMIDDQKERRCRRRTDHYDRHAGDLHEATGPHLKSELPPVLFVWNEEGADEPCGIHNDRCTHEIGEAKHGPDVIDHQWRVQSFSIFLKLYRNKTRMANRFPLLSAGRQFMSVTAFTAASSRPKPSQRTTSTCTILPLSSTSTSRSTVPSTL